MRIVRTIFCALCLCIAASNTYANVLIYSADNHNNYGASAADSLGLTYTAADASNFGALLAGSAWDLVILDIPSTTPTGGFEGLIAYIDTGGKAIMSYWDLQTDPALAAAFEVMQVSSLGTPLNVHPWDLSHPIFSYPNPAIGSLTSWTDSWSDDGDRLNAVGAAVALAGFSTDPESGQAAIVLGNNGHTLYNGFVWDNIDGGTGVQLIANQIRFLLGNQGEPIPEPSTFLLLGPALLALGWMQAKRRHAKAVN